MKCKRCNGPMRKEDGLYRQSSREFGSLLAPETITAWACIMCGGRIEEIHEPIMPIIKGSGKKISKENQLLVSLKAGICKMTEYDSTIWSLRKDLKRRLKKGETAADIAPLVLAFNPKLSTITKLIAAISRLESGRLQAMMDQKKRMAKDGKPGLGKTGKAVCS